MHEPIRQEKGWRSGKTVSHPLDKRNHFHDLLFLPAGEFASFLDQPAHPDDLHTLVLAQHVTVMLPFEQVEPLCTVERDSRAGTGYCIALLQD